MRRVLIVVFVVTQVGAALAQSGGMGGAGAPGGTAGAGGTAPTGHRQPRPSDVPTGTAEDRAQKLQEQKNAEGDRTTKSICSNCGGR
ncbi:hypothetical protein [Chelatococcus reniformis]|uniref:Uncharacterized protein n=1 Tax=Chelatococcus reniformis TaxID=1494448 RepID=A0A916UUV6_9HYPH|nr:hypothetical protein [Chelatococcus reniformis]GGC89620.1 hypothetical protein GCM10010994_54330 [Chelatococcus reniformis]